MLSDSMQHMQEWLNSDELDESTLTTFTHEQFSEVLLNLVDALVEGKIKSNDPNELKRIQLFERMKNTVYSLDNMYNSFENNMFHPQLSHNLKKMVTDMDNYMTDYIITAKQAS